MLFPWEGKANEARNERGSVTLNGKVSRTSRIYADIRHHTV